MPEPLLTLRKRVPAILLVTLMYEHNVIGQICKTYYRPHVLGASGSRKVHLLCAESPFLLEFQMGIIDGEQGMCRVGHESFSCTASEAWKS